ncbi:MAG: cellulase family glycosylhydrolase [Clostridiales bacterium]|nr:cellulase family glycosylhydrolase [Clostridiales bacterium]
MGENPNLSNDKNPSLNGEDVSVSSSLGSNGEVENSNLSEKQDNSNLSNKENLGSNSEEVSNSLSSSLVSNVEGENSNSSGKQENLGSNSEEVNSSLNSDNEIENLKKARTKKIIKMTLIEIGFLLLVLVIVLLIIKGVKGGKDDKPSKKASNSSVSTIDSDSDDSSNSDSDSPDNSTSSNDSDSTGDSNNSSSNSEDNSNSEDVKGIIVTYLTNNTWENGGVNMTGFEASIKNTTGSDIKNWTLVLEIEGLKSCEGWNGTYTVSGETLTITPAEYLSEINNGSYVVIGANIGTSGTLNIKSAKLNGVEAVVIKGKLPENNNNNNNNNNNTNNNNNNNNNNSSGTGKTTEELLKRSSAAKSGDDWLFTKGNKIVDKSGKEVWLTGVNWFGYNTGTNTFDGLWNSELVSSVKAIADHGFNLIRVPMSAELINQWASGEYPQANYNNAYNPDLNQMNSQEIFDYFLKLSEENGIKVMIDIHSADTDASGHMTNLWYTDKVSVNDFYSALEYLAERYKNDDTIVAYDLKNEPHGKPNEGDSAAIWNNSTDANNWKNVAQTAAKKVLAKNPNVLIMVEGIEIYPKNSKGDYSSTNSEDYYFNWWGGNLRGVKDFPINLGKYQNKLVYSPHDYGPTVYEQPWFKGKYTYESLMSDCWSDNWFYIYKGNTAPLLIGEWGGFMKEPNLTWMTYMRRLIKENNLHHTFWCFNANSGDTGGLVLDDFVTWDQEKYNFVKEVLWQEKGKFVGLDHAIPLGENGITLSSAKGL